ncbi:MAG: aminotransferase class V-fold PLP-dependent enzyme [Mesorhizobium sp.]|uniref:aminotransferase class V-fold PLP-dependent enzyme n=1 Tax=unclassified Mesorhizobium TaxID=325217 RepID=UPI000F75CD55|nr:MULTISPECIES: aminotransferase class V-fold PLP-dependent enzyme [unclassified Mesorhizobium]RUX10376.1 aminotransferase class V-fold PLP-dependent enzyme [Mesorhizobium sp. M8A.F.Ca.ET.059.01.1.1]AZO52357.1 aminotransferase class V-fold PLP-dependent enzyme [Mesorhizobium sp. M8A.F.Ca.ET.057.01.1.1]RWE38465.1 MAG: aminotransferase class V-fold PLP-dependent enzyme [Mesorhizobium sp.]RWE40997.1 MAG: aminotransferase class V-fold PLP-dependent enzyme [Mesorhizobium sp.]TIW27506.1 MAG: aminot
MTSMTSHFLPMDVLRQEFPATQSAIYMDVANQGLISRTTRTSMDQHLDNRLNGLNDEEGMMQLVEQTRSRFAQFIGAEKDEIAVTKNASEGINIIGNAIPWKPGDNVVLCRQLEHANNILPWLQLRDKHGVELRIVASDNGAIPCDATIDQIDSRTRIVTVSTVTMVPGFKTVMEPIAEACKRLGAFLLADASQSVGILHTDVKLLGVDGLVASSYKGLMGLYGLGFLYCRREWADRLSPAYLARFSVDLGDAPESAPIFDSVKLRAGAPRFEIGHFNFPGVIAVHASIGQLMEIGTPAIEQSVTSVARRLASGLLDLGLPVCGGTPGDHTGSIVALGDPAPSSGKADSRIQSLHEHLLKNQVIVSARRGMLRFSLHLYNTADEADRVVGLAKNWLA